MSAPLRVAVVGTGTMGFQHARVLVDLDPIARLCAVVDADPSRAQVVARRFHAPAYDSVTAMLDDARPDAVVVAVPTSAHHEVAREVLDRGVPTLVEKPLAATAEQAADLVAVARVSGATLAVGHIERFNPAVIELKRRLDDGALGRPFMIHSRRVSPFPTRIMDVGVVADLATHELDMMCYLSGSEPTHVQASTCSVLDHGHEDVVFALLRFPGGLLGVLDVNWVTPTKVRDIAVTGEKGMFTVNYLTQELCFFHNAAVHGRPESRWLPGSSFSVSEGDMIRYHIERREPLRSELEDFLDAVRTGRPPLVPGEAGQRVLVLAEQLLARAAQEHLPT